MADQNYQLFEYGLHNKGIVARFITDDAPPESYLNLDGWESRQENSISSRLGPMMITTNGTNNTPLTDTNVHTLRRLKGISQTWRYAGAGANLYRRAGDTNGAYTQINSVALSGNRFSAEFYRPSLSSVPYLFIADSAQMLKDNGNGNASKWGIAPPTTPVLTTLLDNSRTVIDNFESAVGAYTLVNLGAGTSVLRVNTTIPLAITIGIRDVTPASMAAILPGMLLEIDAAGTPEEVQVISTTATTFNANFLHNHAINSTVKDDFIQGTVASNTTATISRAAALNLSLAGGAASDDTDIITFWINISDPSTLQEIRLLFDVGDGSFTQSYYLKSITPDTLQSFVAGTATSNQAVTNRVFVRAAGQVNTKAPGVVVQGIDGPTDPGLPGVQPGTIGTGLNQWSLVQIVKSDFMKVGLAGSTSHDWSKVNAWRISVQTISTASLTVGVDDMYLAGGSGLSSLGGIAYDYRATYYDINTGGESNPSQPLIDSLGILSNNQPIKSTWVASTDTQVTHVRLYRRGGSLSTGWSLVATVPIGTLTFIDNQSDAVISGNPTLALDNDMPVTSTLPVPINTTLGTVVAGGAAATVTPASLTSIVPNQTLFIGSGSNQETIYVQSVNVGAGTFTAFFQNPHSNGDAVFGDATPNTPCNLMAVAFDIAWVAGDPNNPHLLYFSKKFNPEAFPPQNFLEIGTPSDPIMGLVAGYRGLLYVFTLSCIYSVFSPGNSPQVYPTAETEYGLVSNFGYCVGSGEIKYQSKDGIRRFSGGASQLMTLNQDWLFNAQSLGPIVPVDKTKFSSTLMAYYNRAVYISYIDINGTRRRISYDDYYQRWRNDDLLANAMFVEKDTNALLIANTSGSIFQDRVNDFDDGGFSSGVQIRNAIPLAFQTPFMDQAKPKFQKNYNEFTLDINTQGETVTLQLVFDNGNGPTITLSNAINTAGRTKLQFNINAGDGQLAYNVSVIISGNVRNVVTLREFAFKAVFETDLRQSFDTYWRDDGSPEWKLAKQGWFNYTASDPAGIAVSIFKDGNMVAPWYTFNLPQTSVRQPRMVKIKPLKCRIYRMVATSASDFSWYDDSFLEIKSLSSGKGYGKSKLSKG